MRTILSILFTLTLLSGALSAADNIDSAAIRSERLAGLCRVWGAIKYFHPYLAYRNIDWDSALIRTIPKVRRAVTVTDYKAAIEGLLGFIKDPSTHVLDTSYQRHPSRITQEDSLQPYMLTTDNDLAVVVASDYSQFSGDIYRTDQLRDLFVDATQTHGVVVDIRRLDTSDDSVTNSVTQATLRTAFLNALPVLLHGDVPLASSRRRVHVGYIPQATANAGDYLSAFEYRNTTALTAAGKDYQSVPIVFVVNEGSEALFDVLAGLQIAHRATVVYEGYFDQEGGIETYDMDLPDSLTVRMRVSEMIKPDGTVSFDPDLVLPFTTDTSLMASPPIQLALDILAGTRVAPPVIGRQMPSIVPNMPEDAYTEMAYPDVEYRLLALFRLWNIVEYFSPCGFDLGPAWDSVLLEFIPRMETASDSLDYVLVLAEFGGLTHDSRVSIETPILRYYFGVFYPPISVRYVAGKTLVSGVRDDAQNIPDIRPGDVILTIDGEDIVSRRKRLSRLLSGSTPRVVDHKVDSVLLGGRNGSEVRLTIQRGDGNEEEIVLTRHFQYQPERRKGKVYAVLPSGVGYIDLDRLTQNEIDSAMDAVRDTPELILDLRGNIDFPPEQLISYFAQASAPAFKICTPERYTPDLKFAGVREKFKRIGPGGEWVYNGRVVALIDMDTGDIAERLCLMLSAADDIVFIGTPTGGGAGDITSTVLPGGIRVIFTGSDIRYPDGRSLRTAGVQPDIFVEPTIDGIGNGKDEILDAAVEYLLQKK